MPENLTMSTKERQRLQVIGHLKHGKTTVLKAAATLGLTERQMYRVLHRYRHQGREKIHTKSGTKKGSAQSIRLPIYEMDRYTGVRSYTSITKKAVPPSWADSPLRGQRQAGNRTSTFMQPTIGLQTDR